MSMYVYMYMYVYVYVYVYRALVKSTFKKTGEPNPLLTGPTSPDPLRVRSRSTRFCMGGGGADVAAALAAIASAAAHAVAAVIPNLLVW